MAFTFLKVNDGMAIGSSLYDDEGAKIVPEIMQKGRGRREGQEGAGVAGVGRRRRFLRHLSEPRARPCPPLAPAGRRALATRRCSGVPLCVSCDLFYYI